MSRSDSSAMASRAVSSIFRPGLFRGKSAIVTGGGTGIGKVITQELLYLGCKVMIASRKLDRLAAAAEDMKTMIPANSPARLEYMQCNIRDEEQVRNLMSKTIEVHGGIDYLVNNGGGQFMSTAEGISKKGFNAVVETNLHGTFICCREAYTQWMKNHGGSIVTIILDMWKGIPMMSHSGAARAGVENLSKTLAVEWAESGVTINCVAPGSSIPSKTAADNYGDMNVFPHQGPRIPAKRLGTPEEISAAVLFLLSPAARFISGDTIKVDGAQNLYNPSIPFEVSDHKANKAYTWEDDLQSVEEESGHKSKL